MKLHILAQTEGIGFAVLGDLPAMGQVRNDRLAAVARVAADQVVEHNSLGAEVEDRPGLVHIEMRRPHRNAHAQDAAVFGVRLRRRELKFRAVELHGYFSGIGEAPPHAIGAHRDGGAALQEIAAGPPWTCKKRVPHDVSLPLGLFTIEHGVL